MSEQTDPVRAALPFQKRVLNWLMECFSNDICRDGVERNHRFLEESLELVHSLGCTRSEAHQLVDYVFDRPAGEPTQELGGVMVTVSALASCHEMDLNEAGETELARVWTKIDKIRAKQLAKPKHSPLPESPALTPPREEVAGEAVAWRTQVKPLDRLSCIIADLYSSEVNFQVSAFFDAGFTVRLGDDLNGFVAENQFDDYALAIDWLREEAIKKYKNSDFAGIYGRVQS